MLTLRQSPFQLLRSDLLEADLFKTLERQLDSGVTQQTAMQKAAMQQAERVPAAEVHDGPEAYTIALELPGVDKASIDVKATDRTLVISAERRRHGANAPSAEATEPGQAQPAPLLSEIRYGTWSRSFRFPGGIHREGLDAQYRDGVLTITAPKAQSLTTVQVKIEA